MDRRTMMKRLSAVGMPVSLLSPVGAMAATAPTDGDTRDLSVRAFGAVGDGKTADAIAIQRAIDAQPHTHITPGTYLIDRPITLRSDRTIAFLAGAVLKPAIPGMTVFTTAGFTHGVRIADARIDGDGAAGVTAFDLVEFRNGCVIDRPMVQDCANGIVLRSLCWDVVVMQPTIIRTGAPIVVADRSNAIDIFHPALDRFDTGILLDGRAGEVAAVRVWGGYVQNGRRGIVDRRCVGSIVAGTYFEGLRDVDIDLEGSRHTVLDATQHYEVVGDAAIRGRGTAAVAIRDAVMSSGARRRGMLDFDQSNSDGRLDIASGGAGATNRPLGTAEGLGRVAIERGGRFRPRLGGAVREGAARYAVADGAWRIVGSDAAIDVDVAWAGHSGAGAAVLLDVPKELQPLSFTPRPRAPVIAEGFAFDGQLVAQMNGEGTRIAIAQITAGRPARLLPIPRDGALSFSLRYGLGT